MREIISAVLHPGRTARQSLWIGAAFASLYASPASAAQAPVQEGPLPIASVALGRAEIAFSYANSIWLVGREGGDARRLTTFLRGAGEAEGKPIFSPDGQSVAFWRETAGNVDLYVAPLRGGEPRRLTFHPKEDLPMGWSSDGKTILFTSRRHSDRFLRLYTVPAAGGRETELPLPLAEEGALSPDGQRVAYVPRWNSTRSWRNYRGGTTTPIWIASLKDSKVLQTVPRENSNDTSPSWIGNRIYFLSDRTKTVNLHSYDLTTRRVEQHTRFEKFDIRSASVADGYAAYVRLGRIELLDLKSGQARPVPVRVRGEFAETRPRSVPLGRWIRAFDLSPSGDSALFGARGEVISYSLKEGKARNLTQSSRSAERTPTWSPDGRSIAYFSDESGEYQIHIRPAEGSGPVKRIAIEEHPSYYGELTWSPDSRKLAFSDKRLALWVTDVESGKTTRIETSTYPGQDSYYPAWSPDGRWLAYTKYMPNRLRMLHLYSASDGKAYPVNQDDRDAELAAFDKSGRYLYYTSSDNAGPANQFGMVNFPYQPNLTRSVCAVVLQRSGRSPLSPNATVLAAGDPTPPLEVEGIGTRIIRLPLPPRNYIGLAAGTPGKLYLLQSVLPGGFGEPATQTLLQYQVGGRSTTTVAEEIATFVVSADGRRVLAQAGDDWTLYGDDPASGKIEPRQLALANVSIEVDPPGEWRQMYHEMWRVMRDYLYDPGHHGQDLAMLERTYEPFLAGVKTRDDLNLLFREMMSHITISHMQIGGGDILQNPDAPRPQNVGMLGADFTVENGRYRLTKIIEGDNSSGLLATPLAQPGVEVRVGDYLLAVDGEEISAERSLNSYFLGKAGRPVKLTVAAEPFASSGREVTVVPLPGENTLRMWAWAEENRKRVEERSGGKLGYLFLPDTGVSGYRAFQRQYYAQRGKKGLIVDERFNSGGAPADLIIGELSKRPLAYYAFREGEDFPFPMSGIIGPKVMIINEYAGSGGDTLPWMFRAAGIGKLVGMRTWGGGIGGYVSVPELIDGGTVLAPNRAFYNPKTGQWDIENHGVSPDIEVELSPEAWRAGKDSQLERAIEVALEELRKHPAMPPKRPAYRKHP